MAVFYQKEDGTLVKYQSKICDACLSIIRWQLEESLPRSYEYGLLNEVNIKQWWNVNKGRSLHELRIELAKQALKQAQETNDFEAVEYLKENLEKIEKEAP
jgi:hypothetical protein